LREAAHNAPFSKVLDKEDYEKLRESKTFDARPIAPDRGEEADKLNSYRRNFFISKPFLDINKDFKFQPLVRNAAYIFCVLVLILGQFLKIHPIGSRVLRNIILPTLMSS
jgi:hypothetical protein